MKNRLIYLFTLLVTCVLNAQIEVEYEYTYRTDSTNIHSAKTEKMVLQYEEGKSIFFSKERWLGMKKLERDVSSGSEINLMDKGRYGHRLSAIKVEKNFSTNHLNFYDTILTDHFTYEENLPKIEWQITGEKLELLGYKVGVAQGKFRGRNYTAWYTEEISISDGPYKFSGLPGMILKIEDDKKNFSFTAIAIAKLKEIDNVIEGNWIKSTRAQYQEIKKKSVVDMVGYIKSNSEVSITPVHPASKKNTEKPYNPIELK